jgi:lipoate-protein ligase A
MKLLDLTLDSPAQNIALDEALVEEAEAAGSMWELLRLWEPQQPMVVIGRSSKVNVEVRRSECDRQGVPIFRRCSGGAAIVTGPGCFMYALVLSYERRPHLRMIENAHRFVLGQIVAALNQIGQPATFQGTSDLTIGMRKFSGNSLRCKRSHLLYHGTILYDFPLDLIGQCLGTPPRQPDYREGRDHDQFVTNVKVSASDLRDALREVWQASDPVHDWPKTTTHKLVDEKYKLDEWNFRL